MKTKAERHYSKYQIMILIAIIILTAAAWVYLALSGSGDGGMVMDMSGTDESMEAAMNSRLLDAAVSVTLPPVGMFVTMWTMMCLAMMLPTAIPMILCMQRVCEQDKRNRSKLPVWLFVLGYTIIWVLFGVMCWGAAYLLFWLLGGWLSDSIHLWLAVGLLFLLCGIYQISPLKNACLKGCQHPLSFLLAHWREGNTGGLIMGLQHGIYCAGCCAALMVVMFPLGMMNLVWMGLFTLLMFFEKNASFGTKLSKIAGWLLIVAGAVSVLLSLLLLIFKIQL